MERLDNDGALAKVLLSRAVLSVATFSGNLN